MWSTIREDFKHAMEGKARKTLANRLIVLLFDSGFQAVALHRLAHWFHAHGPRPLDLLVNRISILVSGVDIGPGAEMGPGFAVGHGVGLVVGGLTRTGRHVLLMQGVTLGGKDVAPGGDASMPLLGDDVLVCAGAKVLGGITVGRGSIIAANSVLLDSVPEGSIVAGIPGRVVGRRDLADLADLADPAEGKMA